MEVVIAVDLDTLPAQILVAPPAAGDAFEVSRQGYELSHQERGQAS